MGKTIKPPPNPIVGDKGRCSYCGRFIKNGRVTDGKLVCPYCGHPLSIHINGGDSDKKGMEKGFIKILFLASNPDDTPSLRLDKEITAIRNVLRTSTFGLQFTVEQEWCASENRLQSYLMIHKPDIVHFCGHGDGNGDIVFQGDNELAHPVTGIALRNLFSILKGNIKLVLLNACNSSKQARAIAEVIDCVIGMNTSIKDPSSIRFSKSFYEALGFGHDIKTAFELGRNQIELSNLGDENIPQLLTKHRNSGKIKFFE